MAIVAIDPDSPDPKLVTLAAGLLNEGRLVAFPTETVYGLGANALDARAVDGIYRAKGRPSYNPLIVHVAETAQVLEVARTWDERAQTLAAAMWPGPLTIVLPKLDTIPDAVTAGLPTVGVRVPRHPVARALLLAARIPVAAPSANRSMQVSPTSGRHVAQSLGDAVDLILDAGPTTVGIESTVIDLSSGTAALLRPGTITLAEIEALIGPVSVARALGGDAARPSPGMLDKHYAPRAALHIVDAADVGVAVERERAAMKRAGAIVIGAEVEHTATIVRLDAGASRYAARLYDTLHLLDDAGCDVIIVERVPDSPEWLGVRDRLERAAR